MSGREALLEDPILSNLRAAIIPVTPFEQNCTLIWSDSTKRGAVVDPGGDVERIKQAIAQTGIAIDKIILTHGHIDHAGGAADLRDDLGVPVIGPHQDDLFLLAHLAETGRGYGFPARDVTPDQWLNEGDHVDIGGTVFNVLHCPGHSPGSVVLFSPENRFALVGDVIFQNSVGRSDFPGGDGRVLVRSIKDKLLPLGDDVSFICGHGPGSTFGQERVLNPFIRGA
jgi:glyoxylase-like metal-dependent hydrolase (beta-lactamase superfamily II)